MSFYLTFCFCFEYSSGILQKAGHDVISRDNVCMGRHYGLIGFGPLDFLGYLQVCVVVTTDESVGHLCS